MREMSAEAVYRHSDSSGRSVVGDDCGMRCVAVTFPSCVLSLGSWSWEGFGAGS